MSEKPLIEFSRRVPLREVPEEGRQYHFEATPEECGAIARRLGLIGVDSLEAWFTVTPEGRGATADGRFEAVVVQKCVVTLEPVTNRVSGEIVQSFAAGGDVPLEAAEVEIDALAEEPPEPLSHGAMELGEIVVEHLALGLDPYPRKADARAELPHEVAEAPDSPFAKLRDMKFSASDG